MRDAVDRRSGRPGGFTLVEVVIAAGLLAAFTIAAARPIQQAVMSAAISADRGAAVDYAVAGIEWVRGQSSSELSPRSNTTVASSWADEARGITHRRTVRIDVDTSIGSQPVLWRLTSDTVPVLTSQLPAQVRRLPGMSNPIRIVSYQCKWLLRGESGN